MFKESYIHNNLMYRITKHLDCDCTGCIYLIFCTLCKSFIYVGESGNNLRLRIANHLFNIRISSSTPISKHFNSSNHSINNFQFIGIDRFSSIVTRRSKESSLISKLKPSLNVLCTKVPFNISLSFPFSFRANLLCNSIKTHLSNHSIHIHHTTYTKGNRNIKSLFHKIF